MDLMNPTLLIFKALEILMKYSENAWLLGKAYIFSEAFDYGLQILDYLRTLEVLEYYGSCHIAVEVRAV